jgi:hypothetical protein
MALESRVILRIKEGRNSVPYMINRSWKDEELSRECMTKVSKVSKRGSRG